MTYYCQTRGIHFTVGLNREHQRFSLLLNNKLYFDLPLHLSGNVQFNGVTLLNGRTQHTEQTMQLLRRKHIGIVPVTEIHIRDITCSSSAVLNNVLDISA